MCLHAYMHLPWWVISKEKHYKCFITTTFYINLLDQRLYAIQLFDLWMYLLQPTVFKPNNDRGVGSVTGIVPPLNEPGIMCVFRGCFSETTGSTLFRDGQNVICPAGKTRTMILIIQYLPNQYSRRILLLFIFISTHSQFIIIILTVHCWAAKVRLLKPLIKVTTVLSKQLVQASTWHLQSYSFQGSSIKWAWQAMKWGGN